MKQFTWKDFERPDGTIKRRRSNEQKTFLAAIVASGWPDIPTWFYCSKNGIPCKTCVVCGTKLNVLSVREGFGYRGWCSKECFKNDNAEAYERRASTNIERYGFSTPAQNETVREKVRESWASKTDEEKQRIVERRSKTSLKKYGTKRPSQSDEIKDKIRKTTMERHGGFEIDLYLPEHNIGIECHGEYWHASNSKFPKAPNYHFQKFLLAKSKGIRLFQFWGFEIVETPEGVLDTIEKAKNGFVPGSERGFIKIDNMKPFIVDGNLYHLEEPKMTFWNGLELWDAGTSYYLSK